MDFGDRAVLLGVVNVTLTATATGVVIVVVVTDRQQRLAVSMSSDHAVTPQTLLTLLKRSRATPKESPAALPLAAPRAGTAYIYIKPETLINRISRLSPRGDRQHLLGVTPFSTICLVARCVSLVFFF